MVVDGAEQSDCWSSFRVGRRAAPANVAFHRDNEKVVLQAEHTGYDHLQPSVRHRRQFTWMNDGFWLIADTLNGDGQHSWSSFCHFHPDVEVGGQGPEWIRLVREQSVLDLCWYGFSSARMVRGQTEPLQGWYADRFGPAAPATVLVLDGCGRLPVRFGYVMVPRPALDAPLAVTTVWDNGVEICIGDRTSHLSWVSQAQTSAI